MNPSLAQRLASAGLDPSAVADIARRGLAEDLDGGVDVTSAATVPPTQVATLEFVARAPGVVAGVPVAELVLALVDDSIEIVARCDDGVRVSRGEVVLAATGLTRALLTGERTALNLLCHLSGIATMTAAWADALAGSGTRVRDTRKTTPTLRALEKYAVRCGGGVNHRMSLSDAALVKDNHVVAAGGVGAAFTLVREMFPGVPVEVEVDSLDQLTEAIEAGADLVLLDNFDPDGMRAAVELAAGRVVLEASGGLTLADAPDVAKTGVDYVAVGALTHSAPVLDIGADLRFSDPIVAPAVGKD